MTFVKIFIVLVSFTVLETVLGAAIQNTTQQHYNADKIVGRWFLITAVSNYRASEIPECITVDINKEKNNIVNFTINISNTDSNYLEFSGTAQIVNSQIRGISSSTVEHAGALDIIDYENDHDIVLHDKETSVYLILGRSPSSVSRKLNAKYRHIASRNNLLYITMKGINCL
ncbi:hypothetical protein PV327_010852 [Microctonus hyperodae]|uniref:Uncharacterized protein n=1 Tax=Microctonus hyperodae TaxID=165561 RepID=A0AA39C8B7_MICHY|nr:hypothetical protein PV327_010852 [Microctonus hyperodae]